VVVGVGQKTYGLFLKLGNHIQEQDYVSALFEFLPQTYFHVMFLWLHGIFNFLQVVYRLENVDFTKYSIVNYGVN